MISKTVYKTPEGKELHITVDSADRKIQNIEISGIEPVSMIEKELRNVDIEEKKITEKIQSAIKKYKIIIIGTTEYSLTSAVLIACGVGI